MDTYLYFYSLFNTSVIRILFWYYTLYTYICGNFFVFSRLNL